MLKVLVRRARGERQRSVEGELRCMGGEQQRTVEGLTSGREGRTAAKCWRVDFGGGGENSSEGLKGGLGRVRGERERRVGGMSWEGEGRRAAKCGWGG